MPGTWSRLPDGQARTDHSAVYHAAEDAMVVFGGRQTDQADSAVGDTWRLTLGDAPAWERSTATGGPNARFAHSAIYDTADERMVVFGGTNDWESATAEVWALNMVDGWANASWQKLSPTGTAPRARYDHAAVYLPNLDWMVAFGGTPDGQTELADLAVLDLSVDPPAWIRPDVDGSGPTRLIQLAGTWQSDTEYALFQGGATAGDSKNATWALACSGPVAPTPTSTDLPSPTPTATTAEPTVPGDTPTPTSTDTPPPTDAPDLVVSYAALHMVGYTGGCVPAYGPVEISIRVQNNGTGAAGAFVVRTDSGLEWEVTGLGPGQEVPLETRQGSARTVTVDADDQVDEADEGNNLFNIPQVTPPPLCTATGTPTGDHKIYLPRADDTEPWSSSR
jgi:hypothetical protein